MHIDELSYYAQLSSSQLSMILLEMETNKLEEEIIVDKPQGEPNENTGLDEDKIIEDEIVNPEKEITFKIGENNYSISLILHRKKA